MSTTGASRDDARIEAVPRFDRERVRAVIDPVVEAHGLRLWDIEWTGGVLRVFIEQPAQLDQPLAGVTLEDCVSVSRDVSTALDVADLIPHAYHLEVSSPGLDRPLRNADDFKRQIGRLAKCKLVEAANDGQMALRGTILGASDEAIQMEVDGKHFDVQLSNIREAKLVFELGGGQPPKPPRPKKTKEARRKRK